MEDDDIPTADVGVRLTCVPVAEINFRGKLMTSGGAGGGAGLSSEVELNYVEVGHCGRAKDQAGIQTK
jgi:hypothetical protein